MKIHLVSLLLVIGSASAFADTPECSRDEAYAAEAVTDYLDSWQNVYFFFKQFRHSYDAAIAEGAEDKIQLLWADHWSTLPQMIALTKKDAEFKAFIWQRISADTFPQDTFARVVRHANTQCPITAKAFCQAIIVESKRAMRPNKSLNTDAPKDGAPVS